MIDIRNMGAKMPFWHFLQKQYADYVFKGQVRHLLNGTFWERTLIPVAPGSYQNGAYWATASGWVMYSPSTGGYQAGFHDVESAWWKIFRLMESMNVWGKAMQNLTTMW